MLCFARMSRALNSDDWHPLKFPSLDGGGNRFEIERKMPRPVGGELYHKLDSRFRGNDVSQHCHARGGGHPGVLRSLVQ
jgi:hypothetical protein